MELVAQAGAQLRRYMGGGVSAPSDRRRNNADSQIWKAATGTETIASVARLEALDLEGGLGVRSQRIGEDDGEPLAARADAWPIGTAGGEGPGTPVQR